MSTVTISEEEFYRLKEKAGENLTRDPSLCIKNGHTWRFKGGANAGCCDHCDCSVSVHECIVCGDCDYGENDEKADVLANCDTREEIEFEQSQEAAFLPTEDGEFNGNAHEDAITTSDNSKGSVE